MKTMYSNQDLCQKCIEWWRTIDKMTNPSPDEMANAFKFSLMAIRIMFRFHLSTIRLSAEMISKWKKKLSCDLRIQDLLSEFELQGETYLFLDKSDANFLLDVIKGVIDNNNTPMIIAKVLGWCKYYLTNLDTSKLWIPLQIVELNEDNCTCVPLLLEEDCEESLRTIYRTWYNDYRGVPIETFYTNYVTPLGEHTYDKRIVSPPHNTPFQSGILYY